MMEHNKTYVNERIMMKLLEKIRGDVFSIQTINQP